MRATILLFALVAMLFSLFWNCESPNDSNDKMAILSGQVVNSQTGDPVNDAIVVILEFPDISVFTDASGFFQLELEVEEATEIQLRAFKESFLPDIITVLAAPGRTIDNLELQLQVTESTPLESGEAASIILDHVTPSSIGVHESGAPEVAELAFQVQDSSGIPVDAEHAVEVRFLIGSSPGGGEFISPVKVMTAGNGLARTSLFSGTVAGAVQIIAEVEFGGDVLRSKPVAVAIHGGLPDSVHFSLAVEKLNFPGYNIYGLTDGITAYVGDKYGNPVKPQTVVYFTTTGGIIEGSALTNALGQASVNLMSAAPKPEHELLGKGFATVTGRTVDENQNQIEAYAIVLFSGIPSISVSPASIDVANGGSQSFFYQVMDQNGNPLAAGTNISVSVADGDIKAVGNTSIELPDTQSPSWTQFGFSLSDAKPDSIAPNFASVKIRVSGPNGKAETAIFGTAR